MNNNEISNIDDDEIDLIELFKIIWQKKLFIVIFTFFGTVVPLTYIYFNYNTPIYRGNVMVEIGVIQKSSEKQIYFDGVFNLKSILKQLYEIKIEIPKKTNSIVKLILTHQDKAVIKTKLSEIVDYILNRHQEKAKLFEKYVMSKQIGNIIFDQTPINEPKNALIVAVSFITSLIMAIFLVFLFNFIRSIKDK